MTKAVLPKKKGPADEVLSRRFFITRTAGLCVALKAASLMASTEVIDKAPQTQPAEADVQLAALGKAYRSSDPVVASRLEGMALELAGICDPQKLDWDRAYKARPLLTDPERVSGEFASGEVVFVDGWILSHSEAAVALLFAKVQFGNETKAVPGKSQ